VRCASVFFVEVVHEAIENALAGFEGIGDD
jgi:hypothetical protein